MKNYFKISVIALAALGISACGSNKTNNTLDKSSPPTVENTQKENQPSTAQSTNTGNSTNPITSDKNVETDSEGVEWRNRTLTPDIINTFKTLKVASNLLDDNTCTGYCVRGGEWIEAPLSSENNHLVIDFKKIAEEDGQIYFGVHEGKFSNSTMQGYNYINGTKVRRKDVDYLFVNQPNTTYGILFDGNTAELFYQGLYSGMDTPGIVEFVVQNKNSEYLNELKGQATYQGQVLATTVFEKDSTSGGDPIPSKPFVDGTVTLTADFGGNKKFLATDSSVKGEIDSKTMGKIVLNETPVYKLANAFEGKAFAGDMVGEYSGLFTGPKLDDAVGRLKVENENAKAGELKEYHAVFGGVKQ